MFDRLITRHRLGGQGNNDAAGPKCKMTIVRHFVGAHGNGPLKREPPVRIGRWTRFDGPKRAALPGWGQLPPALIPAS